MLLQEMPADNKIIIELSIKGQKFEFPSKVVSQGNNSIFIEPIRINGKVLTFNASESIAINIVMIRENKSPIVWKGVGVVCVYEKSGSFYKVSASGEGFEINRRGAFRLFVGISGVAQLGINKKSVDDINVKGNVINMPVRLVFNDFNKNYSLMGIIVRKVIINEAKILYGCQLSVNNSELEHYINQKQRQMLSMNRDNSAFKNKEMLEKALKEPERTDNKEQPEEDDKNYKSKSIKNDGTYKDRAINRVGKTERRDIFREAVSGKKV